MLKLLIYSGVHNSSDEVLFKILKKPFLVQNIHMNSLPYILAEIEAKLACVRNLDLRVQSVLKKRALGLKMCGFQ